MSDENNKSSDLTQPRQEGLTGCARHDDSFFSYQSCTHPISLNDYVMGDKVHRGRQSVFIC